MHTLYESGKNRDKRNNRQTKSRNVILNYHQFAQEEKQMTAIILHSKKC